MDQITLDINLAQRCIVVIFVNGHSNMPLSDRKSYPRKLSYHKVYQHALELFGYDKDKCNAWWMGKHESLNNLSPFEMVKEGKGRELMKMITRCM